MDQKSLQKLIQTSVQKTFAPHNKKTNIVKEQKETQQTKNIVSEAVVILPKTWSLKTEFLSKKTKETHFLLYKKELEAYNKISSQLDAVNKEESNSNHSAFKSLKQDESLNKNAVMLHELYFSNISDIVSEIHIDSLPYMRFARDWGQFETWQYDFRACCMAAEDGWAICYYDPFKNRYMNCVVEGHTKNIPLCGIPVIVMDMHEHAYYFDYLDDKKTYTNLQMKELAWDVIEARMIVAEKANLSSLFAIQPVMNNEPEKMVDVAGSNLPPIGKDQVVANSSAEEITV